jgi:hypothetical protein
VIGALITFFIYKALVVTYPVYSLYKSFILVFTVLLFFESIMFFCNNF